MFGNMTGTQDLDSESLDSEIGLNIEDGPDSDLDGLESDLVGKDGAPPPGIMQTGIGDSKNRRRHSNSQMAVETSQNDDDDDDDF